ncbi:MAG: SulP family inorganic anion transporter [Thermodesulfobacteriota bacterium]
MLMTEKKKTLHLTSDLVGGFAAMLVTFPSAIAYGLIVFSPLGPQYASQGALMGILGTIALGLVAPLLGGTPRLITSPCAPAAAVLAAFITELLKLESLQFSLIPLYIAIITLIAGIMELLLSIFKSGRFIKYIPYPVISGYLSGVGLLIIFNQIPKFLGIPKGESIFLAENWDIKSILIGLATILTMIGATRYQKKIPAAILSFSGGIATYWVLSLFFPKLSTLEGNKMVIGSIGAGIDSSFFYGIVVRWTDILSLDSDHLQMAIFTAATLAILLSIDTLKTCVIVDTLTKSRHDSNKELRGQGLGNMAAAAIFGMPGAGTMGATLININSGGRTTLSGFFEGIFALLAFMLLTPFMAWVPIPVLSGILITGAYRIVDKQSIKLLRQKSTIFDFMVILSVVITALSFNLIAASGVGITFAIFLFLRDQVRSSVITRIRFGNQIFSKKKRLKDQVKILLDHGDQTVVYELQGSLFFGTTDRLYSEIEPSIKKCRFIILDMKRVISIDYTASHRLEQIADELSELQKVLILTSLHSHASGRQNIKTYLEEIGFFTQNRNIMIFEELDLGLEWAEDELIQAYGLKAQHEEKLLSVHEISLFSNIEKELLKTFLSYLREKDYRKGETIFTRGQEGDEIFFIRKGKVRILLPLDQGRSHLLSIFDQGNFFGDMCFIGEDDDEQFKMSFGRSQRSANAVADGEVSLYVLSRSDFDRMARMDPILAGRFYKALAQAIAMRLRQTNTELKALQEA